MPDLHKKLPQGLIFHIQLLALAFATASVTVVQQADFAVAADNTPNNVMKAFVDTGSVKLSSTKKVYYRCCEGSEPLRDFKVYRVIKAVGANPEPSGELTFHDCGEPPKKHQLKVSELKPEEASCNGSAVPDHEWSIIAKYVTTNGISHISFKLKDGTEQFVKVQLFNDVTKFKPAIGSQIVLYSWDPKVAKDPVKFKKAIKAYTDMSVKPVGSKDQNMAKYISVQTFKVKAKTGE